MLANSIPLCSAPKFNKNLSQQEEQQAQQIQRVKASLGLNSTIIIDDQYKHAIRHLADVEGISSSNSSIKDDSQRYFARVANVQVSSAEAILLFQSLHTKISQNLFINFKKIIENLDSYKIMVDGMINIYLKYIQPNSKNSSDAEIKLINTVFKLVGDIVQHKYFSCLDNKNRNETTLRSILEGIGFIALYRTPAAVKVQTIFRGYRTRKLLIDCLVDKIDTREITTLQGVTNHILYKKLNEENKKLIASYLEEFHIDNLKCIIDTRKINSLQELVTNDFYKKLSEESKKSVEDYLTEFNINHLKKFPQLKYALSRKILPYDLSELKSISLDLIPDSEDNHYIEIVEWLMKGDKQKAFARAETAPESAIMLLGQFYEKGIGVVKDMKKAFDCYKHAAKNDDSNAMFALCYREKLIRVKNGKEVALDWLVKSAKMSNPKALVTLADNYTKSLCPQDVNKKVDVFVLYTEAAELGYVDAMLQVGNCYKNGYGVVKNLEEAIRWYSKAATEGNYDAMKILYQIYMSDEANKNLPLAYEWLIKTDEFYIEKSGFQKQEHFKKIRKLLKEPEILQHIEDTYSVAYKEIKPTIRLKHKECAISFKNFTGNDKVISLQRRGIKTTNEQYYLVEFKTFKEMVLKYINDNNIISLRHPATREEIRFTPLKNLVDDKPANHGL